MNIQKSAEAVVKAMGGNENILHVTHCITRLRFKLKDDSIADRASLQKIEGVLGSVNAAGSYQVIVGKYVDSFYEEISKQLGNQQTSEIQEKKKRNLFTITGIDQFSVVSFDPSNFRRWIFIDSVGISYSVWHFKHRIKYVFDHQWHCELCVLFLSGLDRIFICTAVKSKFGFCNRFSMFSIVSGFYQSISEWRSTGSFFRYPGDVCQLFKTDHSDLFHGLLSKTD